MPSPTPSPTPAPTPAKSAGSKARPPRDAAADRPILQWSMALLGGLITLAAIGVILWEAVQPARPPALSARIVAVTASPGGQVAEVEVMNAGHAAAAAVRIEAVLGQETSEAVLDYVPGRGRATAFLRFDADPRSAEIRVKGWSAP